MTIHLTLTDEEAESIRIRVAPCGPGEVQVTICGLCATPEWQQTDRGKPDSVIALDEGGPCSSCRRVSALHPEVFRWVCDVLIGQKTLQTLRARDKQ